MASEARSGIETWLGQPSMYTLPAFSITGGRIRTFVCFVQSEVSCR